MISLNTWRLKILFFLVIFFNYFFLPFFSILLFFHVFRFYLRFLLFLYFTFPISYFLIFLVVDTSPTSSPTSSPVRPYIPNVKYLGILVILVAPIVLFARYCFIRFKICRRTKKHAPISMIERIWVKLNWIELNRIKLNLN